MSFWGHFQEMRKHLVRACLAIAITSTLAFIYKDIIFDFIILSPQESTFVTNRLLCMLSERFSMPALCINQTPLNLINTEMAGQFTTHIWISFIAGLILAFPYIIFELWRFVSPALTKKEKDASSLAVFSISMLFFVGVLFSYFLIVPLTISFLAGYEVSATVNNLISLRSYISTLAGVTFATGLVFE
ncbi:MAG: preprotein translocase subunit TatC, partial [Bacteroidales bacterium]|nr:preprotein translocase subunit TatC [Bacteroidales bacterium]